MKIKRIITNIEAANPEKADEFYAKIFGLEVLMDHGWIRTYGSNSSMGIQIGIASECGSGTPVPNVSIEVDDLEAALDRVNSVNIPIEYGPKSEPWVIRRFYIRDPFGRLINVMQHEYQRNAA